jgi:hypothetical protein
MTRIVGNHNSSLFCYFTLFFYIPGKALCYSSDGTSNNLFFSSLSNLLNEIHFSAFSTPTKAISPFLDVLLFYKLAVLNLPVDLRSRSFAFRGRFGEPPRRLSACGVSPVPSSRRSLAPSAPINIVRKSTMTFNTAYKLKKVSC